MSTTTPITADPDADFAIVAGITDYASLEQLNGAENDARQFYEWVTTKGGVDPVRAQHHWSSTYATTRGTRRDQPDHVVIDEAFQTLIRLSRDQRRKVRHPKIGRRLYVFLAGHGFALSEISPVLALLTANFDEEVVSDGYVAAPLYQKWVGASGAFDEVLLFMDCCGTNTCHPGLRVPFRVPPYPNHEPRIFLAAAAQPGKLTRETTTRRDNAIRGVFSLALEDALSGKTPQSQITTVTLTNYLRSRMRDLLEPADLTRHDVSKQPYIERHDDFVLFDDVPVVPSRVTFHVAASLLNRAYSISDGRAVAVQGVTTARFSHQLGTGAFILEVKDRPDASFEVTGDKDVAID